MIKTNGLVGSDVAPGVSSVTIKSKDVSTVGNYITGVTGNVGVNDTNMLNNYIISSSASGTPTSGNPGSTTTNTVTLIIQVSTVGLPTIDIVNNRQGSSGGSKADTSMIVAHGLIPGQPDELFPSQTYFIGNTRYLPYDGKDKMSLGVKIGTAYDNINPIDYVVVPDIYEMKNLINNKTN